MITMGICAMIFLMANNLPAPPLPTRQEDEVLVHWAKYADSARIMEYPMMQTVEEKRLFFQTLKGIVPQGEFVNCSTSVKGYPIDFLFKHEPLREAYFRDSLGNSHEDSLVILENSNYIGFYELLISDKDIPHQQKLNRTMRSIGKADSVSYEFAESIRSLYRNTFPPQIWDNRMGLIKTGRDIPYVEMFIAIDTTGHVRQINYTLVLNVTRGIWEKMPDSIFFDFFIKVKEFKFERKEAPPIQKRCEKGGYRWHYFFFSPRYYDPEKDGISLG